MRQHEQAPSGTHESAGTRADSNPSSGADASAPAPAPSPTRPRRKNRERLSLERERVLVPELTPADLSAMAELRESYRADLPPGNSWLEEMQWAFLFRSRDRELQAFFLLREDVVEIDGRAHVMVTLSSFYARAAARGSSALPWAVLHYIASLALRFPRARWHAVSLRVTPNGWSWLRGSMSRICTPQSADLSPLEHELLDAYCTRYRADDWDPNRRVFAVPGFRPGVQDLAATGRLELQREYEALCPTPADAILCMGELRLSNLGPTFRRLLRRFQLRGGRRSVTSPPGR